MTKEELQKKVEEYLENNYCCKSVCTCDEIKECKEGTRIRCLAFNYRKKLIVDFAEPREKRIAELEAQIEKMKCCGNCKHRELIRERGQWKERFNCKGNGCIGHSKWEIKEK